MTAPVTIPEWDSNLTNAAEPAAGAKTDGAADGYTLPAKWFNYTMGWVCKWIQYLADAVDGLLAKYMEGDLVLTFPNTQFASGPFSATCRWRLYFAAAGKPQTVVLSIPRFMHTSNGAAFVANGTPLIDVLGDDGETYQLVPKNGVSHIMDLADGGNDKVGIIALGGNGSVGFAKYTVIGLSVVSGSNLVAGSAVQYDVGTATTFETSGSKGFVEQTVTYPIWP
jgi:hypothetical protein